MLNYAIERGRDWKNVTFIPYPVRWSDLDEQLGSDRFEVVICAANSICHVPSCRALSALQNMYHVLKNKGICFVDTKRYDKEGRELTFDEHKGWLPRIKRTDGKIEIDGDTVHFSTFNEYPKKPNGTAKIMLERRYRNGRVKRDEFSFWTTSAEMVRKFMLEAGFWDVFIHRAVPSVWKYDICIGVKQ